MISISTNSLLQVMDIAVEDIKYTEVGECSKRIVENEEQEYLLFSIISIERVPSRKV